MDADQVLLEQVDIEEIAREGAKIYERIKGNYGPEDKGKFLAIDIDSGDVFFADQSNEAVRRARVAHPDRVFYVVKIGYAFTDALANIDAYVDGLH